MTGRTWGGCLDVLQLILTAGRFPSDPAVLDGGVLLLETDEDVMPSREVGWVVRSLGERGLHDRQLAACGLLAGRLTALDGGERVKVLQARAD